MSEFLHEVKVTANKLSLIDAPVSDDDLTLYVLNELGFEFRDMVAPIRTRETVLSFAELHDLLIGHEQYLKRMDAHSSSTLVVTANTSQRRSSNPRFRNNKNHFKQNFSNIASPKRPFVVCQICDRPGHTAKNCIKLQSSPTANYTTSSAPSKDKWLLDSAASHNITSDLANLSIHSEYDGQDEVVLGDGTGLHVTHIGSTTVSSPSRPLNLKETLHVPLIHKNLIFVHKFTLDNNVVVEFHPFFYLVKDSKTGAVLMRGRCEDGVYPVELCSPSLQAHAITLDGTHTSLDCWHHRLGHPSSQTLSSLINSYHLPVSLSKSSLSCVSCRCNKSHKLPFSVTSLTSHNPLEYLYADVWGPSPVPSVDGYRYYVLFVDHFTKYCWFYPMHNKSNVSSIFVQFTTMVENQFSRKIKIFYSDNGGEFIKLRPILAIHGISHFTTAPHTPQQNGTVERRHRHVVDTVMALLHHASAPSTYWTYALATTVYLINHLPTILHSRQSPFEVLFGRVPDYKKLRTFGCQCYPWLVPYRANKFQSKSQPCVFLGYSLTQHAFQCLNIHIGKIYLSCHVTFDESIFPFKLAPPSADPHFATQCQASSPPSLVPPVCMVPLDTPITTPLVHDGAATVPPSHTPGMPSSSPLNNSSSSVSPLPAAPTLLGQTHPMVTRAQNNIF